MFGGSKSKGGGKPMGRQKAKQNPSNETDIFADERERKDEIELTAWKRALKNTRKWKILIILFICTGIVAPMISVRAINTLNDMGTYLSEKYKEISGEKPGKQVALQAVYSWLDGDGGAFQSGYDNLWWNGATEVDSTTADDSSHTETQYWSHRLSLTDKSDGSTRDLTQLVSVTDGVATAVGTPTVLPKTATSNNTGSNYRPSGYTQLDQSTSLSNVVNAWAKAYIGKDSNSLTVLVGDPNSEHAYQPASLGTFSNATIDWLVQCTRIGGKTDKKDKTDTPEWAAAGITIAFKPYAKQSDGSSADVSETKTVNEVSLSITLLIHNPTAGSAKIVDWGANGSVSTLSPFSNALDSSLLTSSSDDDGEDGGGSSASSDSASGESSDTDSSDAGTSESQDASADSGGNGEGGL